MFITGKNIIQLLKLTLQSSLYKYVSINEHVQRSIYVHKKFSVSMFLILFKIKKMLKDVMKIIEIFLYLNTRCFKVNFFPCKNKHLSKDCKYTLKYKIFQNTIKTW